MEAKKVVLHSYKHDHSLHRVWKTETLLENNDDLIIVANRRTRVVEANGRFWYTKEPSVSFFFKQHWYNVIGIIKGEDITFYCNISSPVTMDEEAIKYIDYDLDVKVDSNFDFAILDKNEYNRNLIDMDYSDKIQKILIQEMNDLIEKIKSREFPFKKEIVWDWYKKFMQTIGEE